MVSAAGGAAQGGAACSGAREWAQARTTILQRARPGGRRRAAVGAPRPERQRLWHGLGPVPAACRTGRRECAGSAKGRPWCRTSEGQQLCAGGSLGGARAQPPPARREGPASRSQAAQPAQAEPGRSGCAGARQEPNGSLPTRAPRKCFRRAAKAASSSGRPSRPQAGGPPRRAAISRPWPPGRTPREGYYGEFSGCGQGLQTGRRARQKSAWSTASCGRVLFVFELRHGLRHGRQRVHLVILVRRR